MYKLKQQNSQKKTDICLSDFGLGNCFLDMTCKTHIKQINWISSKQQQKLYLREHYQEGENIYKRIENIGNHVPKKSLVFTIYGEFV